ncbi:MAG: hypothetical protein JNK48_16115 [Bryobacterales bacterium]|nr:hypothetical protein [Bryobacterales bacterium]
MSISTTHSAAARENGAKSFGPVTAEGKARSAGNSRKHGLFGSIRLHTPEEQQAYSGLLNAYLEEFQPATLVEHRCIREMVDAEWRLGSLRNSIRVLEAGHASAAPSDFSPAEAAAYAFECMTHGGQTLSLALRYERHFQRQYESALRELNDSRRRRALDRQEMARRADQAMATALQSFVEAPLPSTAAAPHSILQNEPKPSPTAQPPVKPALRTQPPPAPPIPNLFKG